MTLIALTGGSGYIGSAVVRHLEAGGLDVRQSCRVSACPVPWPVHYHGDVSDPERCAEFVAGVDAVIHTAGLVRSDDHDALRVANVDLTRHLAEASTLSDVRRFVLVSSAGVYGQPSRRVTERDAVNPSNPYEQSKALGESAFQDAFRGEGVIVRPSNVIGEGHPLQPLRRLIKRVAHGGLIVHSGAWTNYVDVEDVARAIVAAATAPTAPTHLIVNAPMPLSAFVSMIGTIVDRPGRTLSVPAPIGRGIRPAVRALGRLDQRFDRLSALLDQTRLESIHGTWLAAHGLDPGVTRAVRAMASEYQAI